MEEIFQGERKLGDISPVRNGWYCSSTAQYQPEIKPSRNAAIKWLKMRQAVADLRLLRR